uniref:Uncharacterized protein n=1 Tax=Anguilla anguilla TaxID=7936 RepID=A0A0E9RXP9_ANGAN
MKSIYMGVKPKGKHVHTWVVKGRQHNDGSEDKNSMGNNEHAPKALVDGRAPCALLKVNEKY